MKIGRYVFFTSVFRTWLKIGVAAPANKGAAAFLISLVIGADSDVPFRPWPQVYAERTTPKMHDRLSNHTIVAIIMLGIGIAVQVYHPDVTNSVEVEHGNN